MFKFWKTDNPRRRPSQALFPRPWAPLPLHSFEPTGAVFEFMGVAFGSPAVFVESTGDVFQPTSVVLEPAGVVLVSTRIVFESTGIVHEPTSADAEPTGIVFETTRSVSSPQALF